MINERVVIFGLGNKLRCEKTKCKEFYDSLNIICFCDNNSVLWGTLYDGKKVMAPTDLKELGADRVIVSTIYYKEVCQSLLLHGIDKEKIVRWDEYKIKDAHGKISIYGMDYSECKNNVLLISTSLNYNGGTIALWNMGKALSNNGYKVTICSKESHPILIEEMKLSGITVAICQAIDYPNNMEFAWINKFEAVIVNVYQMIECAYMISRYRKVLWWLHECGEEYSDIYHTTNSLHFELQFPKFDNITVCAVSKIAEVAFKKFHPLQTISILPFGVEDRGVPYKIGFREAGKKIFAVIGKKIPLKGQKEAVRAVGLLNNRGFQNQYELWLIGGAVAGSDYCKELETLCKEYSNVKNIDEVSSSEMQFLYDKIDVVVCFSYVESMSLVIVEGMMNYKVCITTNNTGIADYVESGINGFICETGNSIQLANTMNWILEHEAESADITKKARRTYEKYFSLEKHTQLIKKELMKISES